MDRIENTRRIVEDVIVPESENSEGLRTEKWVAPEVTFAFGVLRSIGFDDQPAFQAEEIGNVGIDHYLSPEFERGHAPIAKHRPKPEFCRRRIFAHLLRTLDE